MLSNKRLRLFVISTLLYFAFSAALGIQHACAKNYLVNYKPDKVDANPGDGICDIGMMIPYCSLRAAIQSANATPGSDTITLPPGTYNLSLIGTHGEEDSSAIKDLDIIDGGGLTIQSFGTAQAATTIVDGNGIDRVFHLFSNDIVGPALQVNLFNFTITGGHAITKPYGGGGILSQFTNLYMDGMIVSNNNSNAHNGGGLNISNGFLLERHTEIRNSIFSGNTDLFTGPPTGGGIGGAIYSNQVASDASVDIYDTIITGNTTPYDHGAAIAVEKGLVTLHNTTVSGNEAQKFSVIKIFRDGILKIYDSTINNNTSRRGIDNLGSLTIYNSTISGNTGIAVSSGNFGTDAGSLTMYNTTLSGNGGRDSLFLVHAPTAIENTPLINHCTIVTTGDQNGIRLSGDNAKAILIDTIVTSTIGKGCVLESSSAAIINDKNNAISDNSCNLSGSGNLENTDSMLGPLADNGGATLTHLPLRRSPVIDAGSTGTIDLTPYDQRGVLRPKGSRADIGSVEVEVEYDFPWIMFLPSLTKAK